MLVVVLDSFIRLLAVSICFTFLSDRCEIILKDLDRSVDFHSSLDV